jgi:putative glycosyltransferase (TIGR04372 family)
MRLDGPEKRTTRIWFGAHPANRQLFTMWRRALPLVESRALSALYHLTADITKGAPFLRQWDYEFDGFRENDVGPVLSFTPEEEARGRAELARMGIGPDDWWICFQSRDAVFHEKRGYGDSGSHRNCSVENYLPAVRHVTGLGGFALRMGAETERELPETGDPRIIDYARKHRSDFLDVYLLGKCRFLLGCASGTESIPPLFKLPIAQANRVPLWPTVAGSQSLYIPKLVRETASGRVLGWPELEALDGFTLGPGIERWIYPGKLEALGLEFVENGADDIRDLCLDMLDRLEGRERPQDIELQQEYKRRYLKHMRGYEHAPDIGPRFLARYRELIPLVS